MSRAWRALQPPQSHAHRVACAIRRRRELAHNFIKAPYIRDIMAGKGILTETFETAVTWDQFEEFHRGSSMPHTEPSTSVAEDAA